MSHSSQSLKHLNAEGTPLQRKERKLADKSHNEPVTPKTKGKASEKVEKASPDVERKTPIIFNNIKSAGDQRTQFYTKSLKESSARKKDTVGELNPALKKAQHDVLVAGGGDEKPSVEHPTPTKDKQGKPAQIINRYYRIPESDGGFANSHFHIRWSTDMAFMNFANSVMRDKSGEAKASDREEGPPKGVIYGFSSDGARSKLYRKFNARFTDGRQLPFQFRADDTPINISVHVIK